MEVRDNAGVQYNDALGTVAVDWADGRSPADLLKLAGISNVDEYFFVGLSVYRANGGDPTVKIYAVKADAGSNADEVASRAKGCTHEKPLPTHAFEVSITLAELLKYVKRFHILAKQRLFRNMPFGIVGGTCIEDDPDQL